MMIVRHSHLWLCAGLMAGLMLPACDKNSFFSGGNSAPSPEVLQARTEMMGKVIGPYTYRNQSYEDVKVKEVTNEGFKVSHKNGNATFLFQHMPSSVQQRFGYDPDAASASSSSRLAGTASDHEKREAGRLQRKGEAKDLENHRQEGIRKEIADLKAALPSLEGHVQKLQQDKMNSSRKHIKVGVTAWPAVAQRYDRDIAAAELRVSNVRSRLSHLQSELPQPVRKVPVGTSGGGTDYMRD